MNSDLQVNPDESWNTRDKYFSNTAWSEIDWSNYQYQFLVRQEPMDQKQQERMLFLPIRQAKPKRLELPDLSARARSALKLGKDIKFASIDEKRKFARIKRFVLLSVARSLIKPHAIGICMRLPLGRPELWYSPENKRAHWKKIATCGNLWLCAVCAAKISTRKQQELAKAIRSFDGTVFIATFTMQHNFEDLPEDLMNDLNNGFRELKSGRWWQEFESRWMLVGSISALELTVSLFFGWHPHKHVLFFSALPVSEIDQAKIRDELSSQFEKIMQKSGRYVSAKYGVRVEKGIGAMSDGDEALKNYVGKWGLSMELTHGMGKVAHAKEGDDHYNPWQLLELAGTGDDTAAALWLQYAKAIKGKKQLVWSRGLRQRLGLEKVEKSDFELAQEETSNGSWLMFTPDLIEWFKVILPNDAVAEINNYGDSGDAGAVTAFIDSLRTGDRAALVRALFAV